VSKSDEQTWAKWIESSAPVLATVDEVVVRTRVSLIEGRLCSGGRTAGFLKYRWSTARWLLLACAAVMAMGVWLAALPSASQTASVFGDYTNKVYGQYLAFAPLLPANAQGGVLHTIVLEQNGYGGGGISLVAEYSSFTLTESPWPLAYPPKMVPERHPVRVSGGVGYYGAIAQGQGGLQRYLVWTKDRVSYVIWSTVLGTRQLQLLAQTLRAGVARAPDTLYLMPRGVPAVRRAVGDRLLLPTYVPALFHLSNEYATIITVQGDKSSILRMSARWLAPARLGQQRPTIQVVETPISTADQMSEQQFVSAQGSGGWITVRGVPVKVSETKRAGYSGEQYVWLDEAHQLQIGIEVYGGFAGEDTSVLRMVSSLVRTPADPAAAARGSASDRAAARTQALLQARDRAQSIALDSLPVQIVREYLTALAARKYQRAAALVHYAGFSSQSALVAFFQSQQQLGDQVVASRITHAYWLTAAHNVVVVEGALTEGRHVETFAVHVLLRSGSWIIDIPRP